MANTEKSKKLIEQALQNLPQDFVLRDARHHMLRAINEIEKIEKKRTKRYAEKLTPREQWDLDLEANRIAAPPLSPKQAEDVLARIDGLIEQEEKKLQQLREPKPTEDDLLKG
jgi:hypothetical protein